MATNAANNELKRQIKDLKKEIARRDHANKELRENEEKYRKLVEHSLQGVLIIQNFRFVFANKAFSDISGYTNKEILSLTPQQVKAMVHPEDRLSVWKRFETRLTGKELSPRFVHRTIRKDGTLRWIETYASRIDYMGKPAILSSFVDITDRVHAEELLTKRAAELEEANIALKVLLKKNEENKQELKEKLLFNVRELILPYLEKIKKSRMDSRAKTCVRVLETNLDNILSPFVSGMSTKYLRFTPTEVQITNLIKQGKTTKEIALLLNLAISTIKTHRLNIRKKIGISSKKINLKTYLETFT